MSNGEVIQKVLAAFDNNDGDLLCEYLTDDIEWKMIGDQNIIGKSAIKKMFASGGDMKMLSSTKEHIIIQGDQVAVNGVVIMSGKDGEQQMDYCDIYEMADGKVSKMVSYVIPKK